MNKTHKTLILSAILVAGFAGSSAWALDFGIGFGGGHGGPRVGLGFGVGDRYDDSYSYDDGYYDDDGYWVPYHGERVIVVPAERRIERRKRVETEKSESAPKKSGEETTKE